MCARKLPLYRLLCTRMSPSDQTSVLSNTPLTRLTSARRRFWSDRSALESASDQTEGRSNLPMIRLLSVRNCLWPDWRALEDASDHTEVRSKLPLIRPKCVPNYLWSDCCAFEIASDQTDGRSKTPPIRLKCAQNCVWSDRSVLKITYDQTAVRSKLPLTRLTTARRSFWSYWRALEIASDQTEVRSKLPLTRLKCVRPVKNKSTSTCFVSLNFEPNGYVFENRLVALLFLFRILYCFYFRNPSNTISNPDNDFSNRFRASQPGWGPDLNGLWSEHPRRKWLLIRLTQTDFPLIRLYCAQSSVCAWSALENFFWSD